MFHNVKYSKNIFAAACAFGGTYGVGYLGSLVASNLLTNSFLSLGIFIALYFLLYHMSEDIGQLINSKSKIKRFSFAFLTAFFFALTLVFGYQLKAHGMTESGFRGKILIILRSFLLCFSILPFSNYLFKTAEKIKFFLTPTSISKPRKALYAFLSSWFCIFLCWIPVFLAYYPAIMGFDFHRQSQEAMKGFVWFNSYQPLAHTWLIWVAFEIGKAVGSLEIGMACYSIFQMLIFSAACAYSCNVIYRLTSKKWCVILLASFYALFPYTSILSVGVTKDTLFSALFLVFVCLFVEKTFLNTNTKRAYILDILWVIEGIIMMLFRNNAIYAVAAFMIIYFLMSEKSKRLKIFALLLCLVLGGKGGLEGMQLILGTQGRGSQVEMFSVPIQQFARVGYYHGDSLDTETYNLLDTYVQDEYWKNYNPAISDSVKFSVGATTFNETWVNHYGNMFTAWAKIGLKYPNEYIDAFLLLTSGFWFIDDISYAEVLGVGLEERMGALLTHNSTISDVIPEGIAHESKFPPLELFLENIVSANSFYNWPIISNLFKPAFYSWILILTIILFIYNKEKKKLLVSLLPLLYLATLLLGPVVQVRYVLPIIVTIPVILALFFRNQESY